MIIPFSSTLFKSLADFKKIIKNHPEVLSELSKNPNFDLKDLEKYLSSNNEESN